MSALFDICCIKNSKGSVGVSRMDSVEQMNGFSEKCPLSEDSEFKSEPEHKSVKPNLRIKLPQPIRLKNHLSQDENSDLLHSKIGEVTSINTKCSEKVCQSSIMEIPGRGHVPRTPDQIAVDAEAFLNQYFASIRRENSPAHIARIREIKQELSDTGTYQLKTSELVFGSKLAWRNSSRCIGRIQWKKLQIFDCREVTRASGMFEALCNHIKYATNKGNIRSAITIFPQRTDGKHDYRIWNPQIISYAGYRQPDGTIIGDPSKIEITEICVKLGWKPKYTDWDILPLVLQADGNAPEFFELPKEIIMEVHMEHPQYDWFKEFGLRWYAVPAVSNMSFDCGGLEFTATAFNGWYMGTEVGCRNLCDTNRYNVLQKVATKMGLDTNTATSLWKDRALVEVNIAVLHSYHRDNVTIVDHHTASDQFMKHLDVEYKQRGGCPADWIWVVPPMSSSILPVFHQEMALYYLKPSYDYQDPAWKNYQWPTADGEKPVKRKFHFKQIARAVKFTSKLFTRALSKRIKATILYGSETGKSEHYAKELGTIFGHAFNAQVQCMSEYDMFSIEHETLLLIVTSTFGNGEPPANASEFADHLFEMLCNEQRYQSDPRKDSSAGSLKLPSPKALMRTNSIMSPTVEFKTQLSRLESLKSSVAASTEENIGPLSNVCYAVFALGSSAYPKFCNFGKTVDKILEELGGDRILEIGTGDELYGQEQQFNLWASKIFHVACETFCIEDDEMVKDAKLSFHKTKVKEETVRFSKTSGLKASGIKEGLEMCLKKQIFQFHVKEVSNLGNCCDERATIFVNIKTEDDVKYEPGDHLAVMPCNRKEIVDVILSKLRDVDNFDKPVQLQLMKEILSPTGLTKVWENHDRIPAINVRDIFTRFLDITTPPNTAVLKHLANSCTDPDDAKHIQELIQDSSKYDDWKHYYYPHLAEVLEQFPSCRPQASLLTVLLPALQPRFYSISSSLLAHPKEIHLTVAIVRYKTQDGSGPMHYGVCSAYLQSVKPGEEIFSFIRRAPSFHMPSDISAPLILVGPGTGIAPFRGFWHHRSQQAKMDRQGKKLGKVILFFGCRNRGLDLYKDEKEKAISEGVLSQSLIAYSREDNIDKKYVQALLEERGEEITSLLVEEEGHFYVCGDCKMAEDVQQKLKGILKKHAKMNDDEVENYILTLMDENRYHEDIFGITLRTAEVHSASRESAKRTRLESEKSQAVPEVVIN